jgi:glycerophosphoryl diester phosphodiesterase
LRLESVESASDVYQLDSSVEQDRLVAQIPAQLESGVYNMSLQRGEERRMIGRVEFVVKQNPREYAAPKIVAHRGVCNNGEVDNSMESFVSAQNIGGIYGTEFDIFTTSDGVIVLNHDKTINGYTIENSTYEQIKNQTLSNGEKIPTLEALLDQAKSTPSLRLVVEVKTHLDINNTISCTEKAIELIKAKGMENCVDFISFNYQACATAARLLPNITVGFLAEATNPTLQQMHADGINNADCQWSKFLKNNLYYVDEAHALGMTVNTWTVNDAASMFDIFQLGIDFLTTDQCALAKSIYSKRFVEHP